MENLSEGNAEKLLEGQNLDVHDADDISFEETINIDDIQRQLSEHMGESIGPDESEIAQEPEIESELKSESDPEQIDPVIIEETPVYDDDAVTDELKNEIEQNILIPLANKAEIDSSAKKYVIYIDPDNVDFMENLSVTEKKDMINKILREQSEVMQKKKKNAEKRKFLQHSIVATITFIIGFPLMFYGVNKAMEVTISNYKLAKDNFSRLYKDQGKVKQSDPYADSQIKY